MDSTYHITLEAEPKAGDINAIMQGLLLFNKLHTGGDAPQYLVITVRGGDEAIVGGLVGATYLGWLNVHALWVSEELRGHGYGGDLLKAAEEEAVRRGCANACLETLSFQALPFYEKRGYVVYAELQDFPPGGTKYSLAKPLLAKS
ncbi:MAG TPA: GNAT family N-acetyltransferase [Pyrinomonadaceae bacterium]|nr:GNAT family N-acetyltransferase [Pyrinomonadaceae bacterium]